MADAPDASAKSAEKAYAAAAADVKPAEAKNAKVDMPIKVAAPVVAKQAVAPIKKAAPVRRKKSSPVKPATPKTLAKTKAAKRAARVARAAAAPAVKPAIASNLTLNQLKDKIMATAKTTDYALPMADMVGELQTKAKAAYEKGTVALTEATDFTKGNVEAMVESGKILAAGAQSLGKSYVEEAKSAYETMTADVKDMAAVKSPTELFQLQGKIARRNFDAFVSLSSKNTDAMLKLANDAFAPLTGRVTLAAEKLSKVA
jgi:hypothetical protein